MIAVKKEGIVLLLTALAFENVGVLNPAVFQNGAVLHPFYRAVWERDYSAIGYVYYGAADTCIAVASLSFTELINQLLITKQEQNEKWKYNQSGSQHYVVQRFG